MNFQSTFQISSDFEHGFQCSMWQVVLQVSTSKQIVQKLDRNRKFYTQKKHYQYKVINNKSFYHPSYSFVLKRVSRDEILNNIKNLVWPKTSYKNWPYKNIKRKSRIIYGFYSIFAFYRMCSKWRRLIKHNQQKKTLQL